MLDRPEIITDKSLRFDNFGNGEVLYNAKKGQLPAMGWNSWNAFGSGNTQELTKIVAEKIVELGLDKLGYKYVVLDDGCYYPKRVDGKLENDKDKFPDGFKKLGDFIHEKGLKFGMYNDIGVKLCSGLEVGTCGYEANDAASYIDWGIDFIKIDNCYYLWDDATFADPENAKYTHAPHIRSIKLTKGDIKISRSAVWEGVITGKGAAIEGDHVVGIGTFDGTAPLATPVGELSSELHFEVNVPEDGEYELMVEYDAARQVGKGSWLQVAVGSGNDANVYYDNMLPEGEGFSWSEVIKITLKAGINVIRLMNHRRQENTLCSYATFIEELYKINPDNNIMLSICEWGKTHPQHWGYKVGNSWRILNDITFQVGADGDNGRGAWAADYTTSITSQYNKAVIMDEFAGLSKGWNDPDMMVIGMDGVTDVMNRTHMAMWCMLNSPLMLGMDLRRINKGDALYEIIANKELIALNQDALGIQAKRIYSSIESDRPDKVYLRDNERVDVLAKPLADGSVAVAVFNLSEADSDIKISVSFEDICKYIGDKIVRCDEFVNAGSYEVSDLFSKKTVASNKRSIEVDGICGCGSFVYVIKPVKG